MDTMFVRSDTLFCVTMRLVLVKVTVFCLWLSLLVGVVTLSDGQNVSLKDGNHLPEYKKS